MSRVRSHVWIAGRVQGVNFRYFAQQQAGRLGLRGWVRNRSDGRVEAVFEGDEGAVRAMLGWCRQGPPGAWVQRLEEQREAPTEEFEGFTIARTEYSGGLRTGD